MFKFLWSLVFDFPYVHLQFCLGNFSRQEEIFLHTNVQKILKEALAQVRPSNYVYIILFLRSFSLNLYFFQNSRFFTKIIGR